MPRMNPDQRMAITQICHLYLLDGLAQGPQAISGSLAFQGGTSLRLAWGSPRFSEDLDFLVCKDHTADLEKMMSDAGQRLREGLSFHGYSGEVELVSPKDDSGRALRVFWVNYLDRRHQGEKVKVKCEFMPVNSIQMTKYSTTVRTLGDQEVDLLLRPAVEVATLETILADKVTAITCRQHLKHRDLFDVWWLTTQSRVPSPKDQPESFTETMKAELSIYGYHNNIETFWDNIALRTKTLETDEQRISRELASDMNLWLGKNKGVQGSALHQLFSARGTYIEMVRATRTTMEQAQDVLTAHRDEIEEFLHEDLSPRP